MISLKFNSTKNFMKHLLLSDTFNHFQFVEGEIVTFNTFSIDGYIQKAFFDSEENIPEYASWEQLRDFCYSVIKGRRTPLSFKFIFRLSPGNTKKLLLQQNLDFQPEDVQGLYLNIRFDSAGLQCTTETSLKSFSMDKSLEKTWDSMVQKFFDQKNIEYMLL